MVGKSIKVKRKNSIKKVFFVLLFFILASALSFVFSLFLINALIEFNIVKKSLLDICTVILTVILSLFVISIHYILKAKRKNILIKTSGYSKFFVMYVFITVFLGYVKSDVVSLDEAKSLLSIEWTIFIALLAALFTWCIVTDKEIKKINFVENPFGTKDRIKNLETQNKINKETGKYILDVIPVLISLLIITIITPHVCIANSINLFVQTFLFFNLYLITYSLFTIIFDIVSPTITNLFIRNNKIDNNVCFNELINGVIEDKMIKSLKKKNPKYDKLSKEKQLELRNNLLNKEKEKNDVLIKKMKEMIKEINLDDLDDLDD